MMVPSRRPYGLGQSIPTCPDGSEQQCQGGTWVPSGGVFTCTGTPVCRSELPSGSGATSIGPQGPTPCGYSDAPLSDEARAAIERAGHTVSCQTIPPANPYTCPITVCSIDGGPYEHGAYALSLNPAVALVELGHSGAEAYRIASGGTMTAGRASTAGQAASATISNQSRPGNPLRVGDTFLVEVRGAPGQTVSVHAIHNGRDSGKTSYGSTDASGYFRITGQLGPEHAGDWSEVWYVGDTAAPGIQFNVGPAIGAAGAAGDAGNIAAAGEQASAALAGQLTAAGGLLSSPLVLIGLAVGAYLLLKK